MNRDGLLVIFGAGKYGKDLYNKLSYMNIEIDFFVQTKIEENAQIDGIPIISIDDLLKHNSRRIVILFAISNKPLFKEMKEYVCKSMGKKQIDVLDCISFIEDNMNDYPVLFKNGKKKCLICNNEFDAFLPGGISGKIYDEHHIIGGGYRKNCICPICKSVDRERWIYYLLKEEIKISYGNGRFLHFAPERHIKNLIKQSAGIDYYSGDIIPGRAMHITDMTNIQYADNTMDYIMCNHVLEHIEEVDKAISEIKRVLKPDGQFIFSFPICADMRTIGGKTGESDEERLDRYGHQEHVRLYGYDFEEIYSKYGFNIKKYSPRDIMSEEEIEQYGLINDDVVIVAKKNKDLKNM